MAKRKPRLEAGIVYDISFRCDTPGPDAEEGSIRAYWTGETDTWGKLTFVQTHDSPGDGFNVYLFKHELMAVERV